MEKIEIKPLGRTQLFVELLPRSEIKIKFSFRFQDSISNLTFFNSEILEKKNHVLFRLETSISQLILTRKMHVKTSKDLDVNSWFTFVAFCALSSFGMDGSECVSKIA